MNNETTATAAATTARVNLPFVSETDPHHSSRQDAQLYGDLITREEVVRVTTILRSLTETGPSPRYAPYVPTKQGKSVKNWRNSGYYEAVSDIKVGILSEYYEEGKVFSDLLKHWSRGGAHSQCENILNNLRNAIDAGIWTEDGVEEFKTTRDHVIEILEATVPSEYLTVKDFVEKLQALGLDATVAGPSRVKNILGRLVDQTLAVGGNFAGVMHYGPAGR